jgi:uncharacterized membrane protein
VQSTQSSGVLTTRRIAVTGILAAVIILLFYVPVLGYPPIPIPPGNMTTMQIPVIIGAVLEGPVVGLILGFIFGVTSFLLDTSGFFKNPLVAIVPRMLIGVTAYYTYIALKRRNEYLALATSGVVGSLTNSVLVVGALIVTGMGTLAMAAPLLPVIILEAAMSAVLTTAVVAAVKMTGAGRKGSSV